jgi:hypothetical protein
MSSLKELRERFDAERVKEAEKGRVEFRVGGVPVPMDRASGLFIEPLPDQLTSLPLPGPESGLSPTCAAAATALSWPHPSGGLWDGLSENEKAELRQAGLGVGAVLKELDEQDRIRRSGGDVRVRTYADVATDLKNALVGLGVFPAHMTRTTDLTARLHRISVEFLVPDQAVSGGSAEHFIYALQEMMRPSK